MIAAGARKFACGISPASKAKTVRKTYGKELGKASVTGYCIRFKTLKAINIEILEAAIRFGFKAQNEKGELK